MTFTTSRVRKTVLERRRKTNYTELEVKRMAKGNTASMHPDIFLQ